MTALQAVSQLRPGQSEHAGGSREITARLIDCSIEQHGFDLVESHDPVEQLLAEPVGTLAATQAEFAVGVDSELARLLGPTEGEKVVYFNTGAAWCQYDSALDRILQFANVSWPAIVEQAGLGFVTEAAELLAVYRL